MKNDYEIGKQKIIPAVLLYAFFEGQLLMIEKTIWNGLGGKLNRLETPTEAAVREFREEAHCTTSPFQWMWLGQLFFPNFKAEKNEDWWVTVFLTDLDKEQAKEIRENQHRSPEGKLHWVPIEKVSSLPLWPGDREFLPHVLSRTPFQGTLFYEAAHCNRHEISPLILQTRVDHPKNHSTSVPQSDDA